MYLFSFVGFVNFDDQFLTLNIVLHGVDDEAEAQGGEGSEHW